MSWEMQPLGEFCEVVTKGTTPTTNGHTFQESGVNFIKVESIGLNGELLPDMFSFVTADCHREQARSQLKQNDILFSIAGALGRTALVAQEYLPANINQALAIIRLRKDAPLDHRFLMKLLASSIVTEQTAGMSGGVAQQNLSLAQVKDIKIPLPPLPTQRRIAAVLDKAQALVANDKRTLAVYDQLAKSLFLEMFGDPVRNERGWERRKLDDLCQSIVVGFVGACEQFYTGAEGVPMIRTGNLREGILAFSNMKYVTREFHVRQRKSQLQKGDILIARHGDNGKASLYDGRFPEANSLNIVVLRPNVKEMLPDFLINVMNFPTMRTFIASRTGGATQKVVNTKEIQRLEFIVPPVSDQKRFAEKLVQINLQMTKASSSLRRSEGLFGSLLQGAFAGELG